MFNSLIVATDVEGGPDRAVGVAADLAGRGRLPIEMVTVISPQRDVADFHLRRRMSQPGMGDHLTVIHSDDIATAIVDHVGDRDGALLVMTTSASGLLSQPRRHVTAQVLANLRQPVLVLGPAVPEVIPLAMSTLVAAVDRIHDPAPALPVIEAWQRTFGGHRPRLVEVRPPAAWPAGAIEDALEHEHVDAVSGVLAAHGIDATATVLHGGDPTTALLDFAIDVDDPVFVTTTDRWAGGRSHWYATTRHLLQRAPQPVLIVPGDLPGY